ncbi:MAG: methionyl-tRNA formyltransferase [Anaerolineae bacterium]
MEVEFPRIVYAGDRDVAVWVLEFILEQGCKPVGLLVPDPRKATHDRQLVTLCSYLDRQFILVGTQFREPEGLRVLKELKPDYIICVHFPYIVPKTVLEIPKVGVLNLHPAFLPYNRGWHTSTWAILEGTPYGATLHFMTEDVDAGDIVHQKQIEILPEETADTLYQRVKRLELDVFKEAWPFLVQGNLPRRPQNLDQGTFHRRQDLFRPEVQEIKLDQVVTARELITKLRALTTNRIDEAAYFVERGKRYRIQIRIVPEESGA